MVRLNLDPTVRKVVLIAFLLFIEALAIPSYTVITQNRFPTIFEFLGFLLSAIIQLVTFILTFIETGQIPTEPPPAKPAASS